MYRFGFLLLVAVLLAPDNAVATPLLRPCKVPGVEETLRCGDLLVPENPAQADGRQIKIHFVVLPAIEPHAGRAPLFDLAGGPGISATNGASFFATDGSAHRQHRDVVLVDQRGTGESSPLRCAELELAGSLERMYPIEAVRRCRKTLERHADLSQYTTTNTVADLEAVRTALGYEKIDLFGLSYGTRLALAYIDMHPERIHAAALMGVVPADVKMPLWHARFAQATLDDVFADCESDVACRAAYPELRNEWKRVLENPEFDGPKREAFRTLLVATNGQRRLPPLIHAISNGDLEPFTKRFEGSSSAMFSEGLYLSVICTEDTQTITTEERLEATAGTFLGTYRIDEQAAACAEWKVPSAPLQYGKKPSEVPLLVVTGDRDYVTPVDWAKRTVAAFSRSRLVVIPKLGHFPEGLSHMACLDGVIGSFFSRGDAADLDVSCVAEMTPLPFELSTKDGATVRPQAD
ncbi:MAG TPA: alpha/beta fold hydrolase [Thermoanaerobaculia bacterium]